MDGGALYEISLPDSWNEDWSSRILVVYAHGYVDPGQPIALPTDVIPDGMGSWIQIKKLINEIHLGYASTSYRDNGLVVLDAVEDIKELKIEIEKFFEDNHEDFDPPNAYVLVGPSEGGLITVLTMEGNPGLFQGAISTCAPIGNFYQQLQYYGDAHVLFKYFFGPTIKGINLGSPKKMSKHTMNAWIDGSLQAAIWEELEEGYYSIDVGYKINKFLKYAKIPIPYEFGPDLVIPAILQVLRFPIMATNDAIARLEGNPYNNKYVEVEGVWGPRIYHYDGADPLEERKLNLTIERIMRSDWEQAAQNVAEFYETTGAFYAPLVTMHTKYDNVTPQWQQEAYDVKVQAHFPLPPPYDLNGFYDKILVDAFGHCNFDQANIGFALEKLFLLMSQIPA